MLKVRLISYTERLKRRDLSMTKARTRTADMVRMSPALSRRVKILTATKRIVYTPTNSFYQVLSAETGTKHGLNVSGLVFDEIHAQPNRKLYDVLTKGSGDAREQPLFFIITTAQRQEQYLL